MARRPTKGANGTGDTLTVYFDTEDASERRALEGSRLLASKHGRRRQAIVAMLEAVYIHYEQTGELLSATQISAAIAGNGIAAPTPPPASERQPDKPRDNLIAVKKGEATSAKDITKNLLKGASAMMNWH